MKRDDHLTALLDDISDFCPAARAGGLKAMAEFLARTLAPVPAAVIALPGRLLSEPPRFNIRKLRPGKRHAVIVVNGFWSKGETDTADWGGTLESRFGHAAWYHLDWEACRDPLVYSKDALCSLGKPAAIGGIGALDAGLAFAFHGAMHHAERSGKLLAQAIRRTPGWTFTLAGHSLGGRVIHYALQELAQEAQPRIDNAYLLGAAVGGGGKDAACWGRAAGAVAGKIFNCHSSKDRVLGLVYRGVNAGLSQPAGHAPIRLAHERIVNIDCSDLIQGNFCHFDWKSRFMDILERTARH